MTGEKYRALVLSGKKKVSVEMLEAKPLGPTQVRVKLAAGGICGSDMHYYKEYGNTGFTLQYPVVMGHEASGTVAEVGSDVKGLEPGDKVAVNPVLNCGHCMPCRRGQANLCENKRFPGSAMNYPHIDGFFREYFETESFCCVKVPDSVDLFQLAFAEPLSCSMHAVKRAGDLVAKSVLITGAGPIGTLAAAAAKACGAGHVTITDIADEPLAIARQMGADEALNTMKTPLKDYLAGRKPLDVTVDASGAPQAILSCLDALRRGGSFVQLGNPSSHEFTVPWMIFQMKEIQAYGSLQFNTEYETAVEFIVNGSINPKPMLSRQFKFEDAEEAFAAAADRKNYMKVQFIP